LVDQDTEARETSASVSGVGDVGDSTSAGGGIHFNPQGLHCIGNLVVGDHDVADRDVARDRANRDSVATRASVASEDDVGAFVDGEEIILVLDRAVFDGKICG